MLKGSLRATVALELLTLAGVAHAQPVTPPATPPPSGETTPPSTGLADIVVTAQKRSENLQKVPISITVVSAVQLKAGGVSDVQSLKMAAPGVEVQASAGYALPIIRGVGSKATGAGIETPIAFYVDGVYYAAANANLLTFNNIAQIEVLKGPQGTLFGRNATGGLIQITTRDPKQTLGGEANLSYGNYQTFKGDAYLTGGLAPNLAADIAISASTQGKGWGTNLFNGSDVYRNEHDIAVRSKWLFTPGVNTELRLIMDYANARNSMATVRLVKGETVPAPYGPTYGGSPWDVDSDVQPLLTSQSGGVSLRLDQDLGGMRLASITAYRAGFAEDITDYDYTATRGRTLDIPQRDRQFSQELQLLSARSSPVKWVLGAYYFNARSTFTDVRLQFLGPAQIPSAPSPFVQGDVKDHQDTVSYAGFGQATLALTDKLNLTAGLRYTNETRTLAGLSYNTRANGDVVVTFPQSTTDLRASKLTWRLAADYNITDKALVYASYNRGFKSGGFNPAAPALPAFRPEVLDAYEVGAKTSFLDRRLRLNGAAFYYNYKDVQVSRAVNGAIGIYNGAAAHIYGFDGQLDAQATNQLTFTIGYQFLHGTYQAFPGAQIATPSAIGGYTISFGDASGNVTVLSPKSTLSIRGTYTVDVRGGDVSVNAGYYYNSGYFQEPDNVIHQPAYALVNSSLRYQSHQGWSLSVWGDNLTNRAIPAFDGIQSFGASGARRAGYSAPRTYGATIGVKF